MNTIWRFYIDEDRQWRWQQLAVNRSVISESAGAFDGYEACVAAAKDDGYVFRPATGKHVTPPPRAGRRSS